MQEAAEPVKLHGIFQNYLYNPSMLDGKNKIHPSPLLKWQISRAENTTWSLTGWCITLEQIINAATTKGPKGIIFPTFTYGERPLIRGQ